MSGLEMSSQYPDLSAGQVRMPEYFQPTKLESLLPGEIVYLSAADTLAIDKVDRKLYISARGYLLHEQDYSPRVSLAGRVAVMRVIEPDSKAVSNDAIRSNFVADLRHVHPNDVRYGQVYFEAKHSEWASVGAAVLLDPDGELQFIGDADYRSHVEALIIQTDTQSQRCAAAAAGDRIRLQAARVRGIVDYEPRHAER